MDIFSTLKGDRIFGATLSLLKQLDAFFDHWVESLPRASYNTQDVGVGLYCICYRFFVVAI